MVLYQIQFIVLIVTNLRPIYGPRGMWDANGGGSKRDRDDRIISKLEREEEI